MARSGGTDPSNRQISRLRDELIEERVVLPLDGPHGERLLEEISYARGPRVHESRVPSYGCVIFGDDADPADDISATFLPVNDTATSIIRRFADGSRVFLVAAGARTLGLACLHEHAAEERTVIRFVRRSGAVVVRRADDGHVSVVTGSGVVVWDGTNWLQKPHADRVVEMLGDIVGVGEPGVFSGIMELCLHWLMPPRIGATILWHPGEDSDGLDGLERIQPVPSMPLSVTDERHLPALRSALAQTDGALLVGPRGDLLGYGATLLPSDEAVEVIPPGGGTRHTSAHRFSYDHPEAVLVVVSEDGPLTLYTRGERVDLALH